MRTIHTRQGGVVVLVLFTLENSVDNGDKGGTNEIPYPTPGRSATTFIDNVSDQMASLGQQGPTGIPKFFKSLASPTPERSRICREL